MPADQRILVVDDYEVNQIVARKHLESVGYIVDVAVDGSKAIEAFEQNHYHLILMDIEMPVMNGWESTQKIRSIESAAGSGPSGKVPIIAMSGHVVEDDVQRYQQAGMDDMMAKPIERAVILEIVQKWLQPTPDGDCGDEDCSQKGPAEKKDVPHSAPLDMEKAVDEFMGDREAVERLLNDFICKGAEQIISIDQAMEHADFEKVRLEAHALRGGAANLTAYQLAQSCADVEEAAAQPKPHQISPLLGSLKSEFCRLATYVDQGQKTNGSTG